MGGILGCEQQVSLLAGMRWRCQRVHSSSHTMEIASVIRRSEVLAIWRLLFCLPGARGCFSKFLGFP
jgi:hypothetical protein